MSSEDLRALLALQDLDTRIDQEMHRKVALPQRAELAQLEKTAGEMRAARQPLQQEQSEVASRQDLAERDLKATEDRVNQVNARLYGGTVTASRELQAMAADVEALKKRTSDLEDRALAFMEQLEPLDAAIAQLGAQLQVLAERSEALKESLAHDEAEVELVLGQLAAQRPALQAAVPATLLSTYDRLRPRLDGVAVARLTGGRCSGCHLALSAVDLDRARHHEAGSFEYCDQCGRILVVPSEEAH